MLYNVRPQIVLLIVTIDFKETIKTYLNLKFCKMNLIFIHVDRIKYVRQDSYNESYSINVNFINNTAKGSMNEEWITVYTQSNFAKYTIILAGITNTINSLYG